MRSRKRSGSYRLRGDAPDGYLPIPLQKPEGGTSPDGYRYAYVASDASIGDVDGDGQYEIFLKWDPTNAKDNMFAGFTGPTLIDCYRLDGTRLWRIDLGRNVRSGAHYVQFMVFDFDGDGRAELMVKTADGTTDGQGRIIGDAQADWRYGIAAIKADPEAYLKRIREEREEAARRREQWLEIEGAATDDDQDGNPQPAKEFPQREYRQQDGAHHGWAGIYHRVQRTDRSGHGYGRLYSRTGPDGRLG